MSYDDTSYYGDLICDEYDDMNNFMNPPSPTGFYIYHILGDGFDKMSEYCTQFLNDFSILTADSSSLDKFWGVSYNMPRPKLENGRLLTDEEYRIYLYLRNCRLLTMEDILVNMTHCFGLDDYEIYFTNESHYLRSVDHNHYDSDETMESNLARNSLDSGDEYIIRQGSSDNVRGVESLVSTVVDVVQYVNVPSQGWNDDFLGFLEQYISVKGNLSIREYQL